MNMGKVKMTCREKWTLLVLLLMSVFLFADQNAMNPVIKEIMAEYCIDEQQIGVIGSAFTILGAAVSIFFGYFTDRFPRKNLLAFVVLVGEIPCFLTGFRFFTTTYNQLLFLRILTGLGVGGIFPITFSLIGDYFDSRHRGLVAALITSAWGIGQLLGQILSGFLAGPLGWRFPFIIAAAPNFLLVPIFMLIAKEPERGRQEDEISDLVEMGIEYNERIKLSDLKYIFTNKTNLLGLIQGIPGCIPWGLLAFFLVPFYENKGFSKEFGTLLVTILGAGAIIGGIAGGWIGDKIYEKAPKKLPIFCAIAVLLGVIPGYILMTMEMKVGMGGRSMVTAAAACIITGIVITIPGPNIKSILLNVNAPEHRGSVFGLHNISDCIGKGIGPVLGGILIKHYGYLFAMLFSVFMWIPCAIIYGSMVFTINTDIQRRKKYMEIKRNKLSL
jgi:MFS family permease